MSRWASEIDRDLEWREAELASLKHYAISTRMNDTPHRAALRALWAMLYAHFEGFTKFCWDLALDEIEHSKTKREALIDSVAIASLESFFTRLRKDSTSHALWDSFQRHLPEQLLLDAEFPEKYRFSTESNLWPHVFRRETSKLGICCNCSHVRVGNCSLGVSRSKGVLQGLKANGDSRLFESELTEKNHRMQVRRSSSFRFTNDNRAGYRL